MRVGQNFCSAPHPLPLLRSASRRVAYGKYEDRLGLKLESRNSSLEVMMLDRVERPSENWVLSNPTRFSVTISCEKGTSMRTVLFLAALAALQIPSALAQDALPPCDGDITMVRVSTIKPGAMANFMAAVAAHKAWYRSHGFKDNIIVASKVFVRDEKTGTMKYSDTEVVTYHIRIPGGARTQDKRDAAWDAYVKQYRDSSDIKNEYMTCMPKLVP